jgi:tRNA threonylcarbamoyladenosine biosynthesis protein TsaB
MHSLFLDTTQGLTVGLLDRDFSWVFYEYSDEKKPSEIIHDKLYFILNKFNLSIENVQFISIAGPGSYTGMRLSEGVSTILEWGGLKIFSLYHFEVPYLTGIESGRWVTNAFKNQVFLYEWNGEESKTTLLAECLDTEVYSLEKTRELILLHSRRIFPLVVQQDKFKETYYFRTLEEEFG